jgi:hypothetical protein
LLQARAVRAKDEMKIILNRSIPLGSHSLPAFPTRLDQDVPRQECQAKRSIFVQRILSLIQHFSNS